MDKRFQLREEYAAKMLSDAKLEFRGQYLIALTSRISKRFFLKVSISEIEDALEGKRSSYNLLDALCREFDVDWKKAIKNISNNESSLSPFAVKPSNARTTISIDESINIICDKIEFPFEKETHSFMSKPFGKWLKSSFIDLDLCVVDSLPYEYPVFEKESLFQNGHENGEDDFNRLGIDLLHGQRTNTKEVLDTNEDLFVYGDPGSGKSSYLKWIALSCRNRDFLKEYLPIFLEVREFPFRSDRAGILTYLLEIFEGWGVDQNEVLRIISAGRGLFILDGIDETQKSDRSRVLRLIKNLLIDYNACRFIFSSRLGFDLTFRTFKKVVIIPFHSRKQIPAFVRKWFGQTEEGAIKAEMMLRTLKEPKYKELGEISRRPVLLKLLCFLFGEYEELRLFGI